MNRIWPNGKTRKEELTRRLDRAEQLLRKHMDPPRPLRYQCANHLADALGSWESACWTPLIERSMLPKRRQPRLSRT